ncbi:MAG TPA: UDP-N-acetylmuramoyl-L-alanine--D-glutamate ligase [Candidatus Saccharimonas sp.]|nr:UDP-N-acetylmuramoyl-L-alanine--D-glutamate ligase [Candidatus Saccharimonas sp.]
MKITELTGKTICLIGYGREGRAMHEALLQHAPNARITVADADPTLHIDSVALQTGSDYLKDLDNFDVIIRSSGIKNSPELDAVASKTTDMTRIFFDSIADTGVRTVGVTGSKGKSTTTTLIYEALKAHDPNTFLMGNIGIPMITFLPHAKTGATFVVELSSYMLEHLRVSPNVAVITSFFPEHLDRHGSVEAYWAAKKSIAAYQKTSDAVFYNAFYPQCKQLAELSAGQKFAFMADDFPLNMADTKFKGEHNRSNMAAALAVATFLGVPRDVALNAIKTADPLPHRLEYVGKFGGVVWVNDSFSTAPEATIAALEALGIDVDTLLVGGFDRGVDFNSLSAYLAKSPVQNIIIFPTTGDKIKAGIEALGAHKTFFATKNMTDAVNWAATATTPGKICLLSPASPSFNLFKDFVARGEAFVAAAQNVSVPK